MATKKKKREAALARRVEFLATTAEQGQEALRLDKEAREARERRLQTLADRVNIRHANILANALPGQSEQE